MYFSPEAKLFHLLSHIFVIWVFVTVDHRPGTE